MTPKRAWNQLELTGQKWWDFDGCPICCPWLNCPDSKTYCNSESVGVMKYCAFNIQRLVL